MLGLLIALHGAKKSYAAFMDTIWNGGSGKGYDGFSFQYLFRGSSSKWMQIAQLTVCFEYQFMPGQKPLHMDHYVAKIIFIQTDSDLLPLLKKSDILHVYAT